MRHVRAFVVAGVIVAISGCAGAGPSTAPPTVDVTVSLTRQR